jgi:two-component system NtrC family sensor kinase
LEELNLLGERLLTRTDPDFILDTALDHIPRILSADVHGLIITLPDFAKIGLRLPQNATPALIEQVRQDMLHALEDSQADQKHLDLTNIYTVFENPPVTTAWQIKSKLAWPILTMRGTLGIVYLAYGQEFTISANLMRLFSLVVSRIAGVVENAHLFIEVEQERAKLLAILNSAPDGILVIDKAGRVILENTAAYHILGQKTSQNGKLLTEITNNQNLLNLFQTAKKSGGAADEFVNDEKKTFYTSVSPVSAGSKETIIGWVAVMQDVTHFKELNEAKDNFIHAVSHDLRSPLTSILISSQLVGVMGDLTDQQQEMLDSIEKYVDNMAHLINDLLDVGKIEANIDMEMSPQPINPIAIEAVTQLKEQATQKEIDLQLKLTDPSPQVMCNPVRLQQVANNLISNAIKYTPEGGKVIVRVCSLEDNVRFQVIDNGVGISKRDQPHIFDKFYRVKAEHMADKKGTGLGLSIVKSIIEKHGGKIWVESEVKKGSTFTFMLPLRPS